MLIHPRALCLTAVVAAILWAMAWPIAAPADSPAQYQFNMLHAFGASADGAGPEGPLAFDHNGNLYGATNGGGAGNDGTVFELTPGANGQWAETILHEFPSGPGDGENPTGVVMDAAGNLYGMTTWGGANDYGTIFALTPGINGDWTESILYNFCSLPNCADGRVPTAPPTLGPGGVLYGAAGDNAFELTPGTNGWTYTTLYTFCSLPNCADGQDPSGSLTLDAKGNLYGASGGAPLGCGNIGCGQVFVLHPQPDGQWKEGVLYVFPGGDGGAGPVDVTLHDHRIFGPTQAGGPYCFGGCGTVFELSRNPASTALSEQILHDFGANGAQGIIPYAAVTFDPHGNLFGITTGGGSSSCGCGVVYGMKPQGNGQWVYQVLHTFVGTDGVTPNSTLTLDSAGNLYGTTAGGGPNGGGTAFELSPSAQASK